MLINKTVICIFLLGLSKTSCKQNQKNVTITEDIHTIAKAPTIKKLPYFNTPDFTATWLPNTNELSEFHKIPAFNFTNQLGEKVTNKTPCPCGRGGKHAYVSGTLGDPTSLPLFRCCLRIYCKRPWEYRAGEPPTCTIHEAIYHPYA